MKIFKRIFGICETKPPANPDCWNHISGTLEIDLSKTPELREKGAAIRLEGTALPIRLLVVHNGDDQYYAFENRCTHYGRRLDPLPGQLLLQCCSVSKSTFDFSGSNIIGPGKGPIKSYPVERNGELLSINLNLYKTDQATGPHSLELHAGWLMVPYILWVGYASTFNGAIWLMN